MNLLLHDLGGLSPGPQGLPHTPVPVVEASQVHVGVDVLVVIVLLSRSDGLRDTDRSKKVNKMMLNSELRGSSISIQQQVMVETFIQFDNEQQTRTPVIPTSTWT